MLIYLDTNIVQYCADNWRFVLSESDTLHYSYRSIEKELRALRELVELEQFGNWVFAATSHLITELRAGKPTSEQLDTYELLEDAWSDDAWSDQQQAEDIIRNLEQSLDVLNFKHEPDQRHLAEAIALNASWFLTCDKDIVRRAKGRFSGMNVCRPSECLQEISTGLFLRN